MRSPASSPAQSPTSRGVSFSSTPNKQAPEELDPEATPRAKSSDDADVRAGHVEIEWSLPKIEGDAPCPRGGHSAVLADTQLLIFGGHYFGGHGAFVYLNDLHRLDLETSTWHAIPFPERDAVVPRPRYDHRALLLNGGTRMFVFGGRSEGGAVCRDMFFLDLTTVTWLQVQWTTESPAGRFGHGLAALDDAVMWLFGGWDGHRSMNDLWAFDSTAFMWQRPTCHGKAPTPRHGHSMVPLSSDLLMVYGGYTVKGGDTMTLPVYNKDIYLLDVETRTWSRPRLTGEYPVATFGQSLCLHNELAFLVGGWAGTERTPLYMGDKQVRALVQMLAREERLGSGSSTSSKEQRATRKRHTRELKTTSPTLRVLDVTRMQWFRVVSHGIAVSNRYGHSCTIVGPHLFVFGGWDGNRALNQLVVGEFTVGATG
ncbi:hypothetical protein ATCC90586_006626 [Pythium insidiosum]|nr:hypothetical protein ATCC90586_006626 [Pythium insidiosum]